MHRRLDVFLLWGLWLGIILGVNACWDDQAATYAGDACPPIGSEDAQIVPMGLSDYDDKAIADSELPLSHHAGLQRCKTLHTCVLMQAKQTNNKANYYACELGQKDSDVTCPEGQILCNDSCINPLADDKFCGATHCASGLRGENCEESKRVCELGVCICPQDRIMCSGQCVDPQQNDQFCGARGACNNEERDHADYRGDDCGVVGRVWYKTVASMVLVLWISAVMI